MPCTPVQCGLHQQEKKTHSVEPTHKHASKHEVGGYGECLPSAHPDPKAEITSGYIVNPELKGPLNLWYQNVATLRKMKNGWSWVEDRPKKIPSMHPTH